MASAWSVVEGQDSVDYGIDLNRCLLSRLGLLGLIAGSDRAFRRVNLPGIWRDLIWLQAPFLPMQQIEDRLQPGLSLVRLGELLQEGDRDAWTWSRWCCRAAICSLAACNSAVRNSIPVARLEMTGRASLCPLPVLHGSCVVDGFPCACRCVWLGCDCG